MNNCTKKIWCGKLVYVDMAGSKNHSEDHIGYPNQKCGWDSSQSHDLCVFEKCSNTANFDGFSNHSSFLEDV